MLPQSMVVMRGLRPAHPSSYETILRSGWVAGSSPATTARNTDARSGAPSPAADPPAGDQQHDPGRAGHDAVLGMDARYAGFVARHETRQLIRRHQEINRSNDEKDNTEQPENEFHELIL